MRELDRLMGPAKGGDAGSVERIVRIMWPEVRGMSTRYFFRGADDDDVVQTGLIGVLSGIRTYDPSRNGFPFGFLSVCAERAIISGVKQSRREKQLALTEAISLELAISPNQELAEPAMLHEFVAGGRDPAEIAVEKAEVRQVLGSVAALTELERGALAHHLNGRPYASDKHLDNAIQRARRKIRLQMAA